MNIGDARSHIKFRPAHPRFDLIVYQMRTRQKTFKNSQIVPQATKCKNNAGLGADETCH